MVRLRLVKVKGRESLSELVKEWTSARERPEREGEGRREVMRQKEIIKDIK